MTEIRNGKLLKTDITSTAMGGTELIAHRMVDTIPQEYLEGVQIIHSRVRDLEPGLKKILVLHDLALDPEVNQLSDPAYRAQFDKLVFVSHWQRAEFMGVHGITYDESTVVQNAIHPFSAVEESFDKIRLIYHTTPHRGLEILVPVFEELAKEFDNIELDVYSSFNIYGWGERDNVYQHVFQRCIDHPKINYYGFQPNEVIREALTKSHIFAYPCIWQETSSLATIEALCSGNLVVCPNLAALPETTANFAMLYDYTEDHQKHANRFYAMLHTAITRYQDVRNRGVFNHQMTYTNRVYAWEAAKLKWINVINAVKGI